MGKKKSPAMEHRKEGAPWLCKAFLIPVTQKMTRDGAVEVNEAQQTTERISQREQDADFQKTPEQQAAQDAAAQLDPITSNTAPLPRLPVTPAKGDAATAERVIEHIDGAQTRKVSKKAVQKAQRESAVRARSSRLQFTDEERNTAELGKYIEKSDKAADRLSGRCKGSYPQRKKAGVGTQF